MKITYFSENCYEYLSLAESRSQFNQGFYKCSIGVESFYSDDICSAGYSAFLKNVLQHHNKEVNLHYCDTVLKWHFIEVTSHISDTS